MFTTRVGVISTRAAVLIACDALCTAAAVLLGFLLASGSAAVDLVSSRPALFGAPVLVFALATSFFGLHSPGQLSSGSLRSSLLPLAICPTLTALSVLALLPGRSGWLSAAVLVGFLVPAMVLVRVVYRWLERRGKLARRALAVGSVEEVSRLLRLVQRADSGLRFKGIVCPTRQLALAAELLPGLPILGTVEQLEAAVTASRADLIVLGAAKRDLDRSLLRSLRALRFQGVAALDFVAVHERLAREIPLDEIDEAWLFDASMSCSRLHVRWLKRLMDLSFSVLLLVPAALLLAPAALAVRLTSRGPILFRQERLGLGGRPFWLLKLRTMREDAEKLTGPVWSGDQDPRITPVGRLLRKFRLDELPQIVNVLRGDMSLVGPRPERPILAQKICGQVALFPERLLVRPGITGWAQVMAPYASSIADSHRKLQFDLYYIKNLSFWLDVLILFKTASTMILGRERTQGGLTAGRQMAPAAEELPRAAANHATDDHLGSFQISQTG